MAKFTRVDSTFTVGVDLGDKRSVFCVVDREGEVSQRGSVATDRESFRKLFGSCRPRVVLEAGTHSPWLFQLLDEELGCEVFVANPRKIPLIYGEVNKSDQNDAEKLARVGRMDARLLAPIRPRPLEAQADLTLIRARDTLVRTRTDLVNSVRCFSKSYGERLSSCSTRAFAKKVEKEIPPPLRPALLPLIETIGGLCEQIAECDKKIDRLVEEKYTECGLLTQITGVGNLIALAFVLMVGSKDRFSSNRTLGALLGLTPRRDQSGDVDKQLPITKAGDSLMRRLLINASHYILSDKGPDCDLKRFGERLIARGGGRAAKKKAVVAVARKLAVLMHRLWQTAEVYEPLHNAKAQSAGAA